MALLWPCAGLCDDENLLQNGDFESLDASGMPVGWTRDMYDRTDGITLFGDADGMDGSHGASIVSLGENDARFVQTVACEPNALYRLSGFARVDNVEGGGNGANLSVLGPTTLSNTITGTSADGEWTYLELYGLTGEDQTSMDVCVRLGFYGSTVTGEAVFDNVRLEKVDAVPAGATYGLLYKQPKAQPASDTSKEAEASPQTDENTALILICGVCLALLALALIWQRRRRVLTNISAEHGFQLLMAMLIVAAAARLLFAAFIHGYPNDIACWHGWGRRILEVGPWGFYGEGFCDYPPVYMYVLGALEGIRSLLGAPADSAFALILVKLPAIACDITGAALLYHWGRDEDLRPASALLLAALYAFNPATICDSAAWGQIDSVFTLLAVVAIYMCYKEKWHIAIPVYALSALIKPQTLMLAPVAAVVLIWDCVRNVRTCNELCAGKPLDTAGEIELRAARVKRDTLLKNAGIGIGAAIVIGALLVIPFKGDQPFGWLMGKYMSTLSSYDFASVNALNLYSILGLNWKPSSTEVLFMPATYWGYLAMAVAIVYSALLYIKGRDRRAMTLSCATLVMVLFCFSTKMHERYAFPAILLLLLAYVLYRDWRLLANCVVLSLVQFVNMALVLKYMHLQSSLEVINTVFAALGILGTLALCACAWDICVRGHVLSFADAPSKRRAQARAQRSADAADASKTTSTGAPVRYIDRLRSISFGWYAGLPVITMLGAITGALTGRFKLMICLFLLIYIWIIVCRFRLLQQPSREELTRRIAGRSDHRLRMKAVDYALLGAITVAYAFVAFWGLGSMSAPQTEWTSSRAQETVTIDLGEEKEFQLAYYGGICNTAFYVRFAGEDMAWSESCLTEYRQGKIFQWLWYRPAERNSDGLFDPLVSGYSPRTARYVQLEFESAGFKMRELALLDGDGKPLPIADIYSENYFDGYQDDPHKLIDEQDTVPAEPSYYNSMIFDEIYHARTAYEHLHGLHAYEWTHPPLGKELMAIGIAIFGMCPFGWRFMGALTGVLMLPALYLLTQQLFKRRDLSAFTTALMALDMMHITQTRLATIDSYGVFFIMLMYLFMIRYLQMSFFRDKLTKTLIPLGLSGLFMGIGCASKWICIYAGVGLAVLFVGSMVARYNEYRYALRYMVTSTPRDENGDAVRAARRTYVPKLLITLAACVVFFVIVPLGVYVLSYWPHMAPDGNFSIQSVIDLQFGIFNYHAGLSGDTHPFRAAWWTWPLILKPMYYYSGREFVEPGTYSIIWCMGNPAVWWPMLLGMIGTLVACVAQKFRDKRKLIIIVSFAAQFLPWMLVPRSMFIYHYFASIPFMILSMCFALEPLGRRNKIVTYAIEIALVAAALVMFVILYPVATGVPLTQSALEFINKLGPWHLY